MQHQQARRRKQSKQIQQPAGQRIPSSQLLDPKSLVTAVKQLDLNNNNNNSGNSQIDSISNSGTRTTTTTLSAVAMRFCSAIGMGGGGANNRGVGDPPGGGSPTLTAASGVTAATGAGNQQQQTPPTEGPKKDWQLECKYTLSEIQQHNSLDDCWMVIFDKVYNITDFVFEHPGGDFILLEYAGRDATHPFLSSRHGSSAYKMLDKYWIGILVDEELYYSNNSSYCSVYSNLSWRSIPESVT